MARELGGGRAQWAAALAVALSPLPLFEGTEFQYTTFDYLWWVTTAYFVIRLLKTENPRWWLAIGAPLGLGFMSKYTILFLAAVLVGGLLLTRERRYLASGWMWAGAAVAVIIFPPSPAGGGERWEEEWGEERELHQFDGTEDSCKPTTRSRAGDYGSC